MTENTTGLMLLHMKLDFSMLCSCTVWLTSVFMGTKFRCSSHTHSFCQLYSTPDYSWHPFHTRIVFGIFIMKWILLFNCYLYSFQYFLPLTNISAIHGPIADISKILFSSLSKI